jgi:amino acid adenylation domain-containing protein
VDVSAILSRARSAGITLFLDQGRLRFRQSEVTFPAELRQEIADHKDDILAFLALAKSDDLPAIAHRSSPGPVRASYAQEHIWLAERFGASPGEYNMCGAFRLAGSFDVDATGRALSRLVQRHEALRTALNLIEDGLAQSIRAPWEVTVDRVYPDTDPAQSIDEWLARTVSAESLRPFDLEQGRLLRAAYIRLGEHDGVFLLTVHHIAADGHSLQVLLAEFSECYDAETNGRSPRLSPVAASYRDFAVWQRDLHNSPLILDQLAYWEKYLDGAPSTHGIGLSHTMVQTERGRAGESMVTIAAVDFDALLAIGSRLGASRFVVIHAFVSWVLLCQSLQDEIVIGIPVANRFQPELASMVGMLVNMLPIRSVARADLSFCDHVTSTRQALVDAMTRQHVPFGLIAERLSPTRAVDRSPIFQVALSLLPESPWCPSIPGVVATAFDVPQAAKYELTIEARIDAKGCHLTFRHVPGVSANSVNAVVAAVPGLAGAFVSDPMAPLSKVMARHYGLTPTTPVDPTARVVPINGRLHRMFEAQVRRDGSAVALLMEDEQWTYAELDARANRIAELLRGAGVSTDELVALCMEPALDTVAAMLGVLKAGGAYLPIDPAVPDSRLAYLITDASPKAVLTDSQNRSRFDATAQPVYELGDAQIERLLAGKPASGPPDDDSPAGRSMAYVLYTSGSTGRPKGVVIDHHAICERLLWVGREYALGRGERTLHKATVGFDISVWEIFAPLVVGGSVVIASAEARMDPRATADLLAGQNATSVHFVPSMLRVFLQSCGGRTFPDLRHLFCGGEVLTKELLAQAARALPGCTIHNLYGPTEASILATAWRAVMTPQAGDVPIGTPVGGASVHVLNAGGVPLPVGMTGEIHIGGRGVARGYLNRPELSIEKFVRDPFTSLPDARMYRTGDLGFFAPDGMLHYVGRLDFQVKISGRRIEPGEIENAMRDLPGIRDAMVVAIDDETGGSRLVAYLLAGTDAPAAVASAMRDALALRIPSYMVPSAFVRLDRWPINAAGKIDRAALPIPGCENHPPSDGVFDVPDGHYESVLAQIWSDLLASPSIGRNDNFFAIGGNSLALMKVGHAIEQAFGTRIEVAELFKTPVLWRMAAIIQMRSEPVRLGTGKRIKIEL